jgi:hypothetical protein
MNREIHHSVGLWNLVECDGSRFGKPIRQVKEKRIIHSY